MATTTKGKQQRRRSKGDGTIFQNKRGGWTSRYVQKGLPPKEFTGNGNCFPFNLDITNKVV